MGSQRVGHDWVTELSWRYTMWWLDICIQYHLVFFVFLAVLGLRWDTRTPLVVVPELNYPVAYGILVPRPGMESVFPVLEGRFLTTGPLGKSLQYHVVNDHHIVVHQIWKHWIELVLSHHKKYLICLQIKTKSIYFKWDVFPLKIGLQSPP